MAAERGRMHRLLQCRQKRHCDNYRDNDIRRRGHQLRNIGHKSRNQRTAADHQLNNTLEHVQQRREHRTCKARHEVARKLLCGSGTGVSDHAAQPCHQEETQEGDPRLRCVLRRHQVEDHRADTGCKTAANRSEQQTAQQHERVCELDHGGACRRRNANGQEHGNNEYHCRHQTDHHDVVQRKRFFLGFHHKSP